VAIDWAVVIRGWDLRCRLAGGLLLLASGAAQAQAIEPNVEIRAQADLLLAADPARPPPSLPAQGNATQQATVSAVLGGQRGTANVTAQLQAHGTLPQGGLLRQAGDGAGISMSVSGLDDGAPAQTEGLFGSYGMELRNHSAREAYRVTLRIEYDNKVSAEGPAGAGEGAYATALITLGENGVERFSSNLTSDTALGDHVDVTATGGSGQPLSDAGVRTLELDLPPGADLRLQGRQELRGAATTAGAAYHGSLALFVSLVAVAPMRNQAGPAVEGVTQVAQMQDGIDKLMILAACGLPLLAVIWVVLRRRR